MADQPAAGQRLKSWTKACHWVDDQPNRHTSVTLIKRHPASGKYTTDPPRYTASTIVERFPGLCGTDTAYCVEDSQYEVFVLTYRQ